MPPVARRLASNPNLPRIDADINAMVGWLMVSVHEIIADHASELVTNQDTWHAIYEEYEGGPYAGLPFRQKKFSGIMLSIGRPTAEIMNACAMAYRDPEEIYFYMPYSVPTVKHLTGVPSSWAGKLYITLDMITDYPRIWSEYFRRLIVHEITHVADRAAKFKHHAKYYDRPGEVRAYSAQFCDAMKPPNTNSGRSWIHGEVDRILRIPQFRGYWDDMNDASKAMTLRYMVTYAESKGWLK